MVAINREEAFEVNRATAAYSTSIKNTSDLIRHSLRDESVTESSDELLELIIQELTQADIERNQSAHPEQDEAEQDDPEIVA